MKAPCKNCNERSPTCRAECDSYLKYNAERLELLEKIGKEKAMIDRIYDTKPKKRG